MMYSFVKIIHLIDAKGNKNRMFAISMCRVSYC